MTGPIAEVAFAPEDQFFSGYVPSPLDHRDVPYALVAAAGVKVPTSYMFEKSRAPLPRFDQGAMPSCLGWTLAGVKVVQERKDARRTYLFDGYELYRHFAEPGGGAYFRKGLGHLRAVGAEHKGRLYPISAYAGVSPKDHDATRHAIFTQGAVSCGFLVPRSFLGQGGKEFDVAPGGGADDIVGGHAILAVGYNADGVRLHNSWGAGWGDNGQCWVSWGFWDRYFGEVWTTVDSSNRKFAQVLKTLRK